MTEPISCIFTDDETFLIIPDISGLENYFIPANNSIIKEIRSIIEKRSEEQNKHTMLMMMNHILTIINEGTIKENIKKLESIIIGYYCMRHFVCNIPIKIGLLKK